MRSRSVSSGSDAIQKGHGKDTRCGARQSGCGTKAADEIGGRAAAEIASNRGPWWT